MQRISSFPLFHDKCQGHKKAVPYGNTAPTNYAKYGAYSAYFISVPVHVLELSTLANFCWHQHRPKFRIQKVPNIWLLT